MKKHLLALSAAAVLLAPQAVGAEGFAINEWSAEGVAMGGARMFAENDAANFAYNPASMTKVQGEKIKATIAYISPHGKWKADSRENVQVPVDADKDRNIVSTPIPVGPGNDSWDSFGRNRVNPAFAPGLFYVKQLNDKEWLGMGTYVRFGNLCQFERDSVVGSNAFSSRLNGASIGVNYARKHDNKWSTSVGAEINYVGLQLDKNLLNQYAAAPLHLEGTSWALGWNAAANYAFDDKNEFGVVYRSKVKHSMEANYDIHGSATNLGAGDGGDAYGVVTLPESWMLGYGHKFNDKTRMELNATWTRWSRFDALNIALTPGFSLLGQNKTELSSHNAWKDGWRYAIGIEHKLSDKYSVMAGIAHDERGIPDEGADFMVPTGERDTYSIGVQYHDKKQTIALALGYMDVGDLNMAGHNASDAYAKAKMYDSYTKIVVLSYQYNF